MPIQTRYGILLDTNLQQTWGADFGIDFVVPLELVSQWRRCGLVSDFLANYHSFCFRDPKKALSILSTIINELLENAVKFSNDKNKLVTLSLRHANNTIYVETINTTTHANAAKLNEFAFKLDHTDAETLFFEQLETAATQSGISGLGLLSIIKDYDAQLGLLIHPKIDAPEDYEITITVAIDLATIDSI